MTRSRHTADRVAVAAEFRAKIFALHRPVATEDIFDTAAIYAAGDVLLVGCSADIDRAAAETKTGRRIDEQGVRAEIAAEVVADAATHRAEAVEFAAAVDSRRAGSAAAHIGPGIVAFDTEDPVAA